MINSSNPEAFLRLSQSVPDVFISDEPGVLESHGQDWTRFRAPAPLAVAFPETIDQVQRLVQFAAAEALGVVPSGGRTGLSGGALATRGELVVSFDRMRRILHFDAIDRSVTLQPGVATAALQAFAREQNLYYPVSFASEGSSQMGGNIATNAGGIRVLRYGMTRDWVTGLRVVTGKGDLLDCNKGLVKNASGYDFRHLFIGSEGTLGLIVEATMKLTDIPPPGKVMVLGISSLDALMNVFNAVRAALRLSAFEFLTDLSLAHVCRAKGLQAPMVTACPLYVVTEFDCPGEAEENLALECFEACTESGWLLDGVISQSERQNRELWRYREEISESITPLRPYKNDLSVRVSDVPSFLGAMDQLMRRICPDFEVLWYGHIGDGNLHMNIIGKPGGSYAEFESRCHEISEETYALTQAFGGSISAEHGIGVLKQPWLGRVRSPEEIGLMQGIKQVMDPAGILNPGKLLPG